MNWMSQRPASPGFYWFKGRAPAGQYRSEEVVLSTVVELTFIGRAFVVWFPRWQDAFPLSDCEGRWAGPLEVPDE